MTDAMMQRQRGESRRFTARLVADRLSVVGMVVVTATCLAALFGPLVAPYDPDEMMFEYAYHPPGKQFPLGTDILGRDILSRILAGARTSLTVGALATGLALAVGVFVGGVAGYAGGWVSLGLMRIADVQLSVPRLILLIVAASVLGERGILLIACIIGLTQWPSLARVTRSKVLDIKTRDYVDAARACGAKGSRIIARHILPNALGPIAVIATVDIGAAIISEASLSYLGLGDPRAVSWGNMLSTGLKDILYAPWSAIAPGCAIFLAVWGFNMLGDGLRDALDVEA